MTLNSEIFLHDQTLENEERPSMLLPDAIAVHGSGLQSCEDTKLGYKSSWDGRMRITAAGELWQQYFREGREVKIIASGGNNFPSLAPSIAQTIKEELMRRFKIPERDIILADQGGNTVSDIEQVVRIMKENGYKTVINISSRFHKVIENLVKKRGMTYVSAEELLIERSPRYKEIIDDLYSSPTLKNLLETQEKMVYFLQIPWAGERIYKKQAEATLAKRAKVTLFDPHGLQKMVGKNPETV